MLSEIQILDVLSSNFNRIRTYKTLDEKCQVLIDTLRKSGWGRVTLSFLNSKFETKKTLYSGYTEDLIKIAEEKKLAPLKRKELLSSMVERWRISSFYYMPWRDVKARTIVSSGRTTEIPIETKDQWHPMDLLYAPLYYKTRPVAVLTLDDPKDQSTPTKVKLRVPQIIHSTIIQVISEYISQEYFSYSKELKEAIMAKGTIGIIEIGHDGKMTNINLAGEHILKLRKKDLSDLLFLKYFDERFETKIQPTFEEAAETLKPSLLQTIYYFPDNTSKDLIIEFFPQHVLYEYTGMICTVNYPESKDLYRLYSNILDRLSELSNTITGDFSEIQRKIIALLCRQFHFRFPRIYKLSVDKSTLECILSFDEETQDLAFFDHPYNRNSLGSTAIIDDQIIFTTKKERQIRDVRRIWKRLDTPGAIAIPLHVNETIKSVLVCDFLEPVFEIDMSKEIVFKFFSMVLGMTLKPLFKEK